MIYWYVVCQAGNGTRLVSNLTVIGMSESLVSISGYILGSEIFMSFQEWVYTYAWVCICMLSIYIWVNMDIIIDIYLFLSSLDLCP